MAYTPLTTTFVIRKRNLKSALLAIKSNVRKVKKYLTTLSVKVRLSVLIAITHMVQLVLSC